MPRALKLMILGTVLGMISACGQPERPKTVSDLCLNDRRISIEPAPVAGVDDPGNQFDSDLTVLQVLAHNAVVDKLCPAAGPTNLLPK